MQKTSQAEKSPAVASTGTLIDAEAGRLEIAMAAPDSDPKATNTAKASEDAGQVPDLKGMLPEEMGAMLAGMGEPQYRTGQLYAWVHERGVADFAAMTDLPAALRQQLSGVAQITELRQVERRESQLPDLRRETRRCVDLPRGSTQLPGSALVEALEEELHCSVECPLDCQFCATGKMGFIGNLTAAQIVDQLLQVAAFAADRGERVTNVVMMGMGEPLLNYDNVVQALRIMRLECGPAVGGRRITVSTAGYVPGIRRLAADDLNVGLAISLNATTDEQRSAIMPINRKFPIAELLEAAGEYFRKRGRRVTFEYVLMKDVTDTDGDAQRLADLTRGTPCKINLIPYNELGDSCETVGEIFRRPDDERVTRFKQQLTSRTANTVTVRYSRGRDIDAACGQLYRSVESR